MLKPKTRWKFQQNDDVAAQNLVKELKVAPLVASLLVNRGITDPIEAHDFLFNQKGNFYDPFLLQGMDIAVNRIKLAIEKGESILIFGDYDADGVTSTSVMLLTLRQLGANVDYYIPNRFTEGYGPNEQAFRYAYESGVQLIITVDCGIAALHEASVAKELGMDLIITDHHEPGEKLPEALAIIHPKLKDNTYPFKDLAGVGVAFKLAHALLGEVPEQLLDLVAIGTIADLVPLLGENRLLAKKGLERLKITKRIGLQTLLKVANADLSNINEDTVGFILGPRINAAGRLDSADLALELILTDDPYEAETLAEELENLNRERQTLVNEIVSEAIQLVEENYPIEENSVLVVGKAGWNSGVIGIVASKLVDKYYRPTIVLSYDEQGFAKGSARSIDGFDLFQNLSTCRDILPHFGGHPMAAGMTLKVEDVDELRKRLNRLAKEQLKPEDFIPITQLEHAVNVDEVTLDAIEQLELLAPFGMCNPKPKVLIKDVNIAQLKKIGGDKKHLKLILKKDGITLDGIGFGLGEVADHVSPLARLEVIGELTINEWNHIRKPQIYVQDIAVRTWQLFDYRGRNKLEQISEVVEQPLWIVFNQKNRQMFKEQNDVIVISTEEEAMKLEISDQNIVLVDLPPSKKILAYLFKGKMPSRVYVHFFHQRSTFFSTMPTREHFKWFYAFLVKKTPFDLKRYGDELAKYRGWSRETIDFMSQVFLELGFISITNGFITLNKVKNKKDLTESPTYQQKQAYYQLEDELLYSSIESLKNAFDKWIIGSVTEEAIRQWI